MPGTRTASDEPLVTALVATHDAAATLPAAVRSVLRQSVSDLELVVVDDASTDGTTALLAGIDDPRLVVVRNEENRGLARSLNLGLERARGRYVARLDADDVALPDRFARQLAVLQSGSGLAVVGSAVLEIDDRGRPGDVHLAPAGDAAIRWQALFGAPFFHPTVMLERIALDRHGLRYDEGLAESEDYDLWVRVLAHERGENLPLPLVLRRVHGGQATRRRGALQRSLQREIALRAIAELDPGLSVAEAEAAWAFGALGELPADAAREAVAAYLALFEAFVERRPGARGEVAPVVARRLARAAPQVPSAMARALRLAPRLPADVVRTRHERRRLAETGAREARRWQAALAHDQEAPGVLRVVLVSPEPTPYRSPLLDRVADRPEVELTVVYQARTVAGRTWEVEPHHRAVFLDGVRVPGLRRLLRHDYAVTPGVVAALRQAHPDVVVATGWSTFSSQAAVAWCRLHAVPYLLLVSSHDEEPRPGWRRRGREALVSWFVGGASGALVLGTLSRRGLVSRGLDDARIGVFANTIDVDLWSARADRLRADREELRAAVGAGPDDVVVLSVARLSVEKALDDLVRAVAAAGSRLVLVIAGSGPEERSLDALAGELGVRLVLTGDVGEERVAELYVAADAFALLSEREAWGVVVNEAAASGLPLVLSDRVGAAPDLLRTGENGELVRFGDVGAAAAALTRLAADPELRRRAGEASRRLVADWGYEPSVESFVRTVRLAAAR